MPNIVNYLDVRYDILPIYVKHKPIVIGKSKCIVNFFRGIGDDRAIVEVIFRLNPCAKRNFI